MNDVRKQISALSRTAQAPVADGVREANGEGPSEICQIDVESVDDGVVIILHDGDTGWPAILDIQCAVELRDKLSVTLAGGGASMTISPEALEKARSIVSPWVNTFGITPDEESEIIQTIAAALQAERDAAAPKLAAEVERLRAYIQLHAGDVNSLNNEVETFRSHWNDAEDRIAELEAMLDQLAEPYFWTEDGFEADASTPHHRSSEMDRRLMIARRARSLLNKDRQP